MSLILCLGKNKGRERKGKRGERVEKREKNSFLLFGLWGGKRKENNKLVGLALNISRSGGKKMMWS